ncbi:hypothetical protein BJX99DRAFT_262739 [Aspergillus californicus]
MCGIPRASTGHRVAIMFSSPSAGSAGSSSSVSPGNKQSYSLFFQESDIETDSESSESDTSSQSSNQSQTKAIFRMQDTSTINTFRKCRGIDLRIEYVYFSAYPFPILSVLEEDTVGNEITEYRRHGDLTISPNTTHALGKIQPLHTFQLRPSLSSASSSEMEFDLPERLDLGVSERGIVGRQVTVVARGITGEVLQAGRGIVGFD